MPKFFEKANFIFIAPVFVFTAAVLPFSCNLSKDGGIFRSDDFGSTWQQKVKISAKQDIGRMGVLSLAIDNARPSILFMGTQGNGIYKSENEGETWQQLSDNNNVLYKRADVYDVEIDNKNPNYIFAAVLQNSFGKLLRSQDGGVSWQEGYVISKEGAAVTAVEADRRNEGFLYIGTSEGGLLKSMDYGTSWQSLKWFSSGISDIKIDPKSSQIIYVNTENNGLQKSSDFGQTWQELPLGAKDFLGTKKAIGFVIDPRDSGILYAALADAIMKSGDAGQTWQDLKILMPESSTAISAIIQDQLNPETIYYAAGSVFYRSANSGQTWTTQQISTSRKIELIKIDPMSPNLIYLGTSE
ncbi:MAG: hypothetical protein V1845_02695 [bacterium]